MTILSLLSYHIKNINYQILQRQHCINTNVRGVMQSGDVTTRYVTMDTYLVCPILKKISKTGGGERVISYYLLSAFPVCQYLVQFIPAGLLSSSDSMSSRKLSRFSRKMIDCCINLEASGEFSLRHCGNDYIS